MILSTLCYIEKDNQYLMLHRTKKKNDINKDKWIGIDGKFEQNESLEGCIIREVKEETGLHLKSYQLRCIVTYISLIGKRNICMFFLQMILKEIS